MIKNVEKKFEKYLDYNIESSLAGFGRALAFLSDQPMCLTTSVGFRCP